MNLGKAIDSVVEQHGQFVGTMTDLAGALRNSPVTLPANARLLSEWVRNREPELYWQYGLRIRFFRRVGARLLRIERRVNLGNQPSP